MWEALFILKPFLVVIFVITAILLVLIILLQSSREGGLGVIMGSASQTAFGASSMDVITKFTAFLIAIFMISAMLIGIIISHQKTIKEEIEKETSKTSKIYSPYRKYIRCGKDTMKIKQTKIKA